MLTSLIAKIKEVLIPYSSEPLFLNIYLWQYVSLVSLVIGSLSLSWLLLDIIKKGLFIKGSDLKIFNKFKRHTYSLSILGVLLYSKRLLGLLDSPFLDKITFFLTITFAILSLLVINKLIDLSFSLISQGMKKNTWEETGILQLLQGISRVITYGTTFLFITGLLLGSTPTDLLKNLSIGAGTLTAVVALASKDMVSNFFGALVVTLSKPFSLNDWIIVDKIEGRVVSVSVRATKIEKENGSLVSLPNSTFINKCISNYGKTVYVSVEVDLSLMETSESHLSAFLAGYNQLLKEIPACKEALCRTVLSKVSPKKGHLTLHLYFTKMSEMEKIQHVRSLMGKIMVLAKNEEIIL